MDFSVQPGLRLVFPSTHFSTYFDKLTTVTKASTKTMLVILLVSFSVITLGQTQGIVESIAERNLVSCQTDVAQCPRLWSTTDSAVIPKSASSDLKDLAQQAADIQALGQEIDAVASVNEAITALSQAKESTQLVLDVLSSSTKMVQQARQEIAKAQDSSVHVAQTDINIPGAIKYLIKAVTGIIKQQLFNLKQRLGVVFSKVRNFLFKVITYIVGLITGRSTLPVQTLSDSIKLLDLSIQFITGLLQASVSPSSSSQCQQVICQLQALIDAPVASMVVSLESS